MTQSSDGWQSERCTAPKCRQALDAGAGNQFRDEKGQEQRYCWKHWVKLNTDVSVFPGHKEEASA